MFFVSFVLPFIVCGVSSSNIPQAFLITCILEGAIAIIGNALCNWKKIKWAKCEESACNVCIQVAYIVLMVILWCFAGWIFDEKATTDKSLTPEKSRDYNQECSFLEFFDAHDLWHILSSHALLVSAYVVMFMSHRYTFPKPQDGYDSSAVVERSKHRMRKTMVLGEQDSWSTLRKREESNL